MRLPHRRCPEKLPPSLGWGHSCLVPGRLHGFPVPDSACWWTPWMSRAVVPTTRGLGSEGLCSRARGVSSESRGRQRDQACVKSTPRSVSRAGCESGHGSSTRAIASIERLWDLESRRSHHQPSLHPAVSLQRRCPKDLRRGCLPGTDSEASRGDGASLRGVGGRSFVIAEWFPRKSAPTNTD